MVVFLIGKTRIATLCIPNSITILRTYGTRDSWLIVFSTHMQSLTGQLELSKSHYPHESVFHTNQGIMLEMKWVKTIGLRTSRRDEMWVETDECHPPPPCRQVRDMEGFAITNIPNSITTWRTYGTRSFARLVFSTHVLSLTGHGPSSATRYPKKNHVLFQTGEF
jgi:hypothetical protein